LHGILEVLVTLPATNLACSLFNGIIAIVRILCSFNRYMEDY
jgi:hypothetical protein